MSYRCKHSTVLNTLSEDGLRVIATRCSPTFGCGQQLPLGQSNDAPAEVQVEIRAAEIVAVRLMSNLEGDGWRDHALATPLSREHWGNETAGYLARELVTHDDRETRDADAWAWDITRPVAGQYERQIETARLRAAIAGATAARHADLSPGRVPYLEDQLPVVDAPALPPLTPDEDDMESAIDAANEDLAAGVDPAEVDDNLEAIGLVRFEVEVGDAPIAPAADVPEPCEACGTADGCEEHRLFTCAGCGKLTPWSDGADDEDPDKCSECWAATHDALIAEIASAPPREPLTQAERAEVARILSDVPSDEPLPGDVEVELIVGDEPELGVKLEVVTGPLTDIATPELERQAIEASESREIRGAA